MVLRLCKAVRTFPGTAALRTRTHRAQQGTARVPPAHWWCVLPCAWHPCSARPPRVRAARRINAAALQLRRDFATFDTAPGGSVAAVNTRRGQAEVWGGWLSSAVRVALGTARGSTARGRSLRVALGTARGSTARGCSPHAGADLEGRHMSEHAAWTGHYCGFSNGSRAGLGVDGGATWTAGGLMRASMPGRMNSWGTDARKHAGQDGQLGD